MAYTNYESQPFTDDPSDPGNFAISGGSTDYTDALTSGTDTEYIYSSTSNHYLYLDPNSNFTRDLYRYEPVRVKIRCKRVGGTSCYLELWPCTTQARYRTDDIGTSWTDVYMTVHVAGGMVFNSNNLDDSIAVTSNSGLHFIFRLNSSGSAEVQISEITFETIPLADQGILVINADGTNTDWTPSAGSNYACVDNASGVATGDWTGGGNSSTSDYVSTTNATDVDDYATATPTYTGLGTNDSIIVWALTQMMTGSTLNDPITPVINESGTSRAAEQPFSGSYPPQSKTAAQYTPYAFVLTADPTDWADIELKVTAGSTSSNTLRVYCYVIVSAFAYSPATNYDVSITEAITVGDTQAGVMATFQAIAESITVGDTQSGLAGSFGTFAEGITVGDAQTALASALGSVSESILLADILSGVQSLIVSISEGISVGDTQSAVASALAALAESTTVGDTQTALAGALAALTEGVVTGDTQSGLATALAILAAENVNLTDLVSGLQVFLVSISEGITVGDTQSAIASALAALSESITAGDTQSAVATALATLGENVVTGDTQSAVAAAIGILAAENVNLTDLFTALQLFLAAITEGITVGDSVSAEAAALAAFAESLAAGDAPSATATALAALSEGITNAEVFAAVAAAYASVNEGILVGETWSYPLIGAHLVGTFSIEPLLAASPSNQPLLAATVTTEGLEGVTITINR